MEREEAAAQERWEKESQVGMSPFSWPWNQEELEVNQRAWDALGGSREEQTEMIRVFKLKRDPEPSIADGLASDNVSQPRPSSLPRDSFYRTRSSRLTKNTAKNQNFTNRGTPSARATPMPSQALMPDHQSKRPKQASNTIGQAPQSKTTQHKTAKGVPEAESKSSTCCSISTIWNVCGE